MGPAAPQGDRIAPSRPLFDGFVLDYGLTTSLDTPLRNPGFTLGGGATLLGGALDATVVSAGPFTTSQYSWTGVWRDNTVVKQFRIGDRHCRSPAPALTKCAVFR